jgi:hypothetical protein
VLKLVRRGVAVKGIPGAWFAASAIDRFGPAKDNES